MGLLDVLKSIGGGIEGGLDYIGRAKIAREMTARLGPDWEQILQHQAGAREHEEAMRPGQLEQQTANIASTEAGTEATVGGEERAEQLFPGQLTEQDLRIIGARQDIKTGEKEYGFMDENQAMKRGAYAGTQAGRGIGVDPATMAPDWSNVADYRARSEEGGEIHNEYMQAMIQQIRAQTLKKGLTDVTDNQIFQALKLNMSGGLMEGTKELTPEVLKATVDMLLQMETVRQAVQAQGVR